MSKRTILIALFILGLVFTSISTLAGYIPEDREVSKDLRITGNMPEVKLYAERFNVDPSEAARRLNLQVTVDDYYKQLEQNHAETFAGLYFEHEPEYRIVVQFANDIPADIRRDVPNSARKDVEFRKVRFSLVELELAQEEVMELLADRGLNFHSSISLSKNLVEIYASSREEGNAFLEAIDTSLAEKLTITDPIVLDLPEPEVGEVQSFEDLDLKDQTSTDEFPSAVDTEPWEYVRGGAKLYQYANGQGSWATAGFPIWKGSWGMRGISAAAHGPKMTYYFQYIPITRRESAYGAGVDVAWYSVPTTPYVVTNQIDIGSWGIRDIWMDKWRWAQQDGEWVCKYGRATGPGCGSIISNTFTAPGEPVPRVLTDIPVHGGDSGGPFWSEGTTAYGTTIARVGFTDGTFGSIYAPVDQLYQYLGVRPLTWR